MGTSARELLKIAKFLCPHHLRVHKVQNFYQLIGFECPLPPMIVYTTQAAFIFEKNDDS